MKAAIVRILVHVTYYPSKWFSSVMYRLGFWKHWNWVDDRVLLGGVPSRRHIAELKRLGIGAIINMCEEFDGYAEELADSGIEQLHLPTLDYYCPSEEDLLRGLAFLDEQFAAGRKVYVHCKAGRGRAATMALVYVMKNDRQSAAAAQRLLKSKRRHVSRGLYRRDIVQRIEKMLREDPSFRDDNDLPPSSGSRSPGSAGRRAGGLAAWAVLATAVFFFHGCSIHDGLWLDDHRHAKGLREGGWSLAELMDVTRLQPSEWMHAWWQTQDVTWQYARPVSVALMKTVYLASGGAPAAQHALSLALHWIAAVLVFQLCLRVTGSRTGALIGGLIFVAYPLSVFAVGWLAAQNVVLQTALCVAAVLCYGHASGLVSDDSAEGRWCGPAADEDVGPISLRWLFAATVCWLLALGSRENAVVMPVFFLAMDWAYGGRRLARARWAVHVGGFFIAVLYLLWRATAFDHAMPPVYVRRPDGLDYLPWALAKLMHYVTCAIWPAPMTIGPSGRDNPFIDAPGDCLLAGAILAVIGGGYVWLTRRERGRWLWPLWILLAVLPVVPVLATPHTGYFCGVGYAVGVVVAAGFGSRRWADLRPRRRRFAVPALVIAVSTAFVAVYRLQWQGVLHAEQHPMMTLADEPPPAEDTDVFFINLPFVNVFAKLSLEEAWGAAADRVQCHVLTYSPVLMRFDQACVIEQLDDHRFAVSVEGQPYFSRLLGRFFVEAMRGGGAFERGDTVAGDLFDVVVTDATADGVSRLEFRFHEPLASARFRFYVTSDVSGATRLRFRPPATARLASYTNGDPPPSAAQVERAAAALRDGDAQAGEVLFNAVLHGDAQARSAATTALTPVVRFLARASASPLQATLASETIPADTWRRCADWWDWAVDDALLAQVWMQRDALADIAYRRDEITRIPEKASWLIRSDLYLTGEPFPGPR